MILLVSLLHIVFCGVGYLNYLLRAMLQLLCNTKSLP